ncbi:MAG: CoA-binding protein, partial [Myxococcota bacterium]
MTILRGTTQLPTAMPHPLEDVIRNAYGFLIIGDSSQDRFPAMSFHNNTATGQKFYCLDLGGLTESRGRSAGRKVYTSVAELPEDRSDLAVIWVKPKSAKNAVDVAKEAGCTRVWFSFQSGHRDAVSHARELAIEVVEIGRCPVHYMADQVPICRSHTVAMKLT